MGSSTALSRVDDNSRPGRSLHLFEGRPARLTRIANSREEMSEGSSSAAAINIASTGSATTPWVEKYRPSTIDQVAHQDEVVHTLRNALATGNVRHRSCPSLLCANLSSCKHMDFDSLLMYGKTVSDVTVYPFRLLQLPHLLFYGPPGTGKTSTILALAKDLYGPENYKSRVLELNASDERGIDIVRTKIKNFASLAVSTTAKK